MNVVATRNTRAIAQRMAVEVKEHGADVVLRYLPDLEPGQVPALLGLLARMASGAPIIGDMPIKISTDPAWVCGQAAADAAYFYGIDYDEMMSLRKAEHLYRGRSVAMTAANMAGVSLSYIGRHFGQHHTTVMYATRRVAKDAELRAIADRIAGRLVVPDKAVA